MSQALSYPALSGDVVTQGHVNHCATHGHATHLVDGIDDGICPRCGEVKDASQPEAQDITCPACGREVRHLVLRVTDHNDPEYGEPTSITLYCAHLGCGWERELLTQDEDDDRPVAPSTSNEGTCLVAPSVGHMPLATDEGVVCLYCGTAMEAPEGGWPAPMVKVTPETFPVGTRVMAEGTHMRRRITGTVTFWSGEVISVRWDNGATTATFAAEGGLAAV